MLFGLGAINLAKNPDGLLALIGHQRLEQRVDRERKARIAEAEAAAHGGEIPEHERTSDDAPARCPRRGRSADGTLAAAGVKPPRRRPPHPSPSRGLAATRRRRRRLRRRSRCSTACRSRRRAGHGRRAARRQRRRQVDAVRGRRRGSSRPHRAASSWAAEDVDRPGTPTSAPNAASCWSPRRAASSPGSRSTRTCACSCAPIRRARACLRPLPDPEASAASSSRACCPVASSRC